MIIKNSMPENVYFIRNEEGGFDISLNGKEYPSIEDAKEMLKSIKFLVDKLEEMGSENIKKENEKIRERQLKECRTVENKNKKQKKEKGWIYLLKCNGIYKIGRTKKPNKRIDKYKTENPFKVKVLFKIKVEEYKEIEEYLIECFKYQRVKGKEWFNLTDKNILFIKDYLKKYEV